MDSNTREKLDVLKAINDLNQHNFKILEQYLEVGAELDPNQIQQMVHQLDKYRRRFAELACEHARVGDGEEKPSIGEGSGVLIRRHKTTLGPKNWP